WRRRPAGRDGETRRDDPGTLPAGILYKCTPNARFAGAGGESASIQRADSISGGRRAAAGSRTLVRRRRGPRPAVELAAKRVATALGRRAAGFVHRERLSTKQFSSGSGEACGLPAGLVEFGSAELHLGGGRAVGPPDAGWRRREYLDGTT